MNTIFSKTVPRDTYTPINKASNKSVNSTTTADPGDINDSLSQGAIAGIAIAVILGVILILAGTLVWLDRRHAPIPKKMMETAKTMAIAHGQWQKPELEGTHNTRHEMGISEPRPHEVHGEGVMKYELPGCTPSVVELQ